MFSSFKSLLLSGWQKRGRGSRGCIRQGKEGLCVWRGELCLWHLTSPEKLVRHGWGGGMMIFHCRGTSCIVSEERLYRSLLAVPPFCSSPFSHPFSSRLYIFICKLIKIVKTIAVDTSSILHKLAAAMAIYGKGRTPPKGLDIPCWFRSMIICPYLLLNRHLFPVPHAGVFYLLETGLSSLNLNSELQKEDGAKNKIYFLSHNWLLGAVFWGIRQEDVGGWILLPLVLIY